MQRGMTLARLLSLLSLLVLTATVSSATAQNTTGRSGRAKPAPKQATGGDRGSKDSLPEQDCRAYAQELIKALGSGNLAAANALVDWDSLFGTSLNGLALADNHRKDLIAGLKHSLEMETGITGQLIKNCKAGGRWSISAPGRTTGVRSSCCGCCWRGARAV